MTACDKNYEQATAQALNGTAKGAGLILLCNYENATTLKVNRLTVECFRLE